jgi:RNA polymerase sigma-70 factor (ECF subfamily)
MTEAWWQAGRKPWGKAEFEALFLAHYGEIYRLLFRLVGSPEEAEDLAQETFLRLYRRRFPVWREQSLRAWLYRVATNLAYNALRGQQRRARRQETVQRLAEPSAEPDPAEVALRRGEQEAVRQVLAALPRRQTQLLLLYYAGLSYRELSEVLGMAPGSVGTLLARAKAAFAEEYRTMALAHGGGVDHEV